MRITSLTLLAVMSVVVVTECKPLSDDVKEAPCVDCEQKNLRKKRCIEELLRIFFGGPIYIRPRYNRQNVYIGNGSNNINHVHVSGVNQLVIGNGRYNKNYVYYYN